jgi:ribosome-interacting GTPase 1
VVIREDITTDQLIDFLSSNRVYIPAILVLNKIDLMDEYSLNELKKRFSDWTAIPISADAEIGIQEFKDIVYRTLKFINIYMKPQGKPADMEEPMVITAGSTVGNVCAGIHRDFQNKFRYAKVWGPSSKFPGQTVGLDHELQDGDILTIVIRR